MHINYTSINMSLETDLKKDGITVLERLDTLQVNLIAKKLSTKLCQTFPEFNLSYDLLFMKLCRLNMYYAEMKEGMAEANYCYKNSTIYFNKNMDFDNLEDYAIHECIHFLQELKDKKNHLIRMGHFIYADRKAHGLALNEASVQLMSSLLTNKQLDSVKYFGISFSTISPSCYPIECCLVRQMAYITGSDALFKSTLFSNDDFKEKFSKLTSEKTYQTVESALDEIIYKEDKLIELNNMMSQIQNRNAKVDMIINKINMLKRDIQNKFIETQNLLITSYFNSKIETITNQLQIDQYRTELYKFRDYLGFTDTYTFFDDFYLEKLSELEHKSNVLEYGGNETAINIRETKETSKFILLLRKIKELILGKSRQENESKN